MTHLFIIRTPCKQAATALALQLILIFSDENAATMSIIHAFTHRLGQSNLHCRSPER